MVLNLILEPVFIKNICNKTIESQNLVKETTTYC